MTVCDLKLTFSIVLEKMSLSQIYWQNHKVQTSVSLVLETEAVGFSGLEELASLLITL